MLKLGTKVKFSKRVTKKREEPIGRTYMEEIEMIENAKHDENGNNKGLELFYSLRKIEETKETQGFICGIRNLGFKRRTFWHWLDVGDERNDEFGREIAECIDRKKCYLVAVNMKNLSYVLCEDVEEISNE